MISLYIHIPFCDQKCKYCSFNVVPTRWNNMTDEISNKMIYAYVDALCKEITFWWQKAWRKEEVKTLYFGGGTPSRIGYKNLAKIIDHISDNFDMENLWELSIELNPYPEDQVFDIIDRLQNKYKDFPRIRWSIWLQTFDTEILEEAGRMYSFPAIMDFLRELKKYKNANTIFNFDFIAFWKFNKSKKWNIRLWDDAKWNFLLNFVKSHFADSFSLYTLELFSGSERFNIAQRDPSQRNLVWWKLPYYGTEDDVYEEFGRIKEVLMEAGYRRYEISNFTLTSKDSIHNRVYRNMESYLWLWTSWSSFLLSSNSLFDKNNKKNEWSKAVRFTNTILMADYIKWNYIDDSKTEYLDEYNFLVEQFFLKLRTEDGISNIYKFVSILEDDWEDKLTLWEEEEFILFDGNKLILTDKWMDVFNEVITELVKF